MKIEFDPNINYKIGLTYHSFIYFGCSLIYTICFGFWIYLWIKYREFAKSIPLFIGYSCLGLSFLINELLTGFLVLIMEIFDRNEVGMVPNILLFLNNLLILWNISSLYMLLMLSAVFFDLIFRKDGVYLE